MPIKSKVYHHTVFKTASIAVNTQGDRIIKVRFPFEFEEIKRIKQLPIRSYNKEKQYWEVPLSAEYANILQSWGYLLNENLVTYLVKYNERKHGRPIEIPGLQGTLRPFQNTGVSLIDHFRKLNGRGVLLADDQGLGKTVETLAWLQLHPEIRPAIVICPACVKINWKREAKTWMSPSPNVQILKGQKPSTITGDIVIINFNLVYYWRKQLNGINAKAVIVDECQNIKNNGAQQTYYTKKIAKKSDNIVLISGTPIENRVKEIYNAWQLLDPDNCPVWIEFGRTYCDGKHTGFGWDFNGASNTVELHNRLVSTIMIRRLKKDVLPELPNKTYSFEPLEIDNEKEYRFAEDNFIEFIRKTAGATFDEDRQTISSIIDNIESFTKKYSVDIEPTLAIEAARNKHIEEKVERVSAAEILTQIESLKQLAILGKMNQVYEWIDNFLESGNKLVIFARHKFIIDLLMERYGKISGKVDGRTSLDRRQQNIDKFQNSKNTKIIIISEAGGIGITLTAAFNMLVIEFPWTPGKLDQAVDRIHRITQKYAVIIHYMMAVNTIEERLGKIIDGKREVTTSVLDGTVADSLNLFEELMNDYINN
jgi:SWI/SNF-related matrix-associated actin-dependent regulator of chromatin subfamily A-like protein 1